MMTLQWYIVIGVETEGLLEDFKEIYGENTKLFETVSDSSDFEVVGPVYMDPDDPDIDLNVFLEDVMEVSYPFYIFFKLGDFKVKKYGLFDA